MASSVLRTPTTPWDILENITANSMVKLESHVVQNSLEVSSSNIVVQWLPSPTSRTGVLLRDQLSKE